MRIAVAPGPELPAATPARRRHARDPRVGPLRRQAPDRAVLAGSQRIQDLGCSKLSPGNCQAGVSPKCHDPGKDCLRGCEFRDGGATSESRVEWFFRPKS